MSDKNEIITAAKAALDAVAASLVGLREKENLTRQGLIDIQKETQLLRESPLRFEDFEAYIGDYVKARSQAYADGLYLEKMMRKSSRDGWDISLAEKPWSAFEDEGGAFVSEAISFPDISSLERNGNPFGAFCFFAPEAVTVQLKEQFRKNVHQKWGNDEAVLVKERRSSIAAFELQEKKLEDELEEIQREIAEIVSVLAG